ncbi:hypothetical protein ACHAXT_001742 [Thalassiosira profunda]
MDSSTVAEGEGDGSSEDAMPPDQSQHDPGRDMTKDGESEAVAPPDAMTPPATIPEGPTNASNTNNAIAERLDRELKLSRAHRLELQSHWRNVLSKEKFQELHDGIPRLMEHHEQNVERKKSVIEARRKEVHHLQELYRDAMVANMHRMEDLIAVHDDNAVTLERDFRERVASLQSQFRTDAEQINARYEAEKEAARQSIQRVKERDEEQVRALRQEHQRELEEIRNHNLEHVNGIRFAMDSRTEDLEERFEQTRSEFAQNTGGARAAYEQLKAMDDAMRAEVERKARRANALQREIQRFRLVAKQEEAQIEERRKELVARKARAIARWNATQEEMTRFRDGQQKKLVDMIRRANKQKEELRQQCVLAERVKKIALACRKWESSTDELASSRSEPLVEKEGEERSSEPSDEQKAYIVDCMGRLGDTTHRFWDKYNVAKLDVLQLEKRIRRLKERETELRLKHKQYSDGITVNDDVLKNRNPLFVINGKMNAAPESDKLHGLGKKTRMHRRLTVVDGNHFFATQKMAQVAS